MFYTGCYRVRTQLHKESVIAQDWRSAVAEVLAVAEASLPAAAADARRSILQ